MVNRINKIGRFVGAIKDSAQTLAGKKLSRAVTDRAVSSVRGYAKGGLVKKTGLAKLHKGETVLSVAQKKALKKMLH